MFSKTLSSVIFVGALVASPNASTAKTGMECLAENVQNLVGLAKIFEQNALNGTDQQRADYNRRIAEACLLPTNPEDISHATIPQAEYCHKGIDEHAYLYPDDRYDASARKTPLGICASPK